jgi:hypothetical protein
MPNLHKYPRTPHLPWSKGMTSDDKMIDSLESFMGKHVIVTEKMDGENTTLYSDYLHARSLDSKGGIERDWLKSFWSTINFKIPKGWRIYGENLWAQHSIRYDNLESFFYGFSVWDESNKCLSWDETVDVFEFLNISHVPILYSGVWNDELIKNLENQLNLQTTEGYVVRLADSFLYKDFNKSVAKFVRENHVSTDKHWKNSQLIPNGLNSNVSSVSCDS